MLKEVRRKMNSNVLGCTGGVIDLLECEQSRDMGQYPTGAAKVQPTGSHWAVAGPTKRVQLHNWYKSSFQQVEFP